MNSADLVVAAVRNAFENFGIKPNFEKPKRKTLFTQSRSIKWIADHPKETTRKPLYPTSFGDKYTLKDERVRYAPMRCNHQRKILPPRQEIQTDFGHPRTLFVANEHIWCKFKDPQKSLRSIYSKGVNQL